jgi:hypothetical protein
MKTKYLVVEGSYEYNDETYDSSEDDAYTIKSALFSTEAEAQAEADRLNSNTKGWWQDSYATDQNSEPIIPYRVVSVQDPE